MRAKARGVDQHFGGGIFAFADDLRGFFTDVDSA